LNIGGTAAGQYNQLKITGTATLAGTLNISLVYGYTPSTGTTFPILTYASKSGDFGTKNLGGFTSALPGATADILKK
jgi:hypothetical protein